MRRGGGDGGNWAAITAADAGLKHHDQDGRLGGGRVGQLLVRTQTVQGEDVAAGGEASEDSVNDRLLPPSRVDERACANSDERCV